MAINFLAASSFSQQGEVLDQQLEQMQNAFDIVQQGFTQITTIGEHSPFVVGLTVFVLAIFVGYYVVWRVTPALHSPLMAVTNAISSVVIVGALLAAGFKGFHFTQMIGFLAVVLASINIFGGFMVTQRMLQMFSAKKNT